MAWLIHSSGPWKDHKYKERSGSPGNYTYKYGDEKKLDLNPKNEENSNEYGSSNQASTMRSQYQNHLLEYPGANVNGRPMSNEIRRAYAYERTGKVNTNKISINNGKVNRVNSYGNLSGGTAWTSNLGSKAATNIEEHKKESYNKNLTPGSSYRKAHQEDVRNAYAYERTGAGTTKAVGGDSKRNEIKGKQAKEVQKRKDFEKMTLTSMRNALNSAKENKKKSDADMRDTAVARGREQYMTNRAKKTVGAMSKAIEKKREEEKRKAYEHSRLNRLMGR